MKKILLFFTAITFTLSLQACSTIQDAESWKTTKRLYFTYINSPVEVDYEEIIEISDAEALLSTNLIRVDYQLTSFQDHLEQISLPPSGAELQAFMNRFPWVSGVALINTSGEVTGAYPEQYSNSLNFAQLLSAEETELEQREGKPNLRKIRVSVQADGEGQIILVGRPAFDNEGAFLGVFITYFDMRELFSYVQMDPAVFSLAGNTPLWLGDYTIGQTPLAGIDFIEETNSSTRGTHKNDYGTVSWINRYFYEQPIIFAVMMHNE